MKTKLLPSLFLLTTSCFLHAAQPMTANFSNGDSITGTLTGIDGDSILWDSDFFTKPEPLILSRLVDVTLPGNANIELPDGDHIAELTLTNGDVVQGALTSLGEKEIQLKTNFAGDLVFRRDMVAALNIEDKPEIIYTGPNGLDEWNIDEEGDWTYENGELISDSSSSISRDIGDLDQFHVSFDIEWRGSVRFRVFTCADNTDLNKVGNCYELVCQPRYAYMRKRTERNGETDTVTIGTTGAVREFQEKEKVRVELLHDKITGRVRFILGDRVVDDWREPAPGAGKLGSVLHFLSESGKEIRISRIRVASWDGTFDGKVRERRMNPFGADEPEEDEEEAVQANGIILRNGDSITGDTIGIEDGKVRMKTELGEFELPVSRLRTLALRTSEEAADPELTWKPIIRNGDIRAHFSEGDYITFQLIGFGDGSVRGRSQTFGEAEFKLSAFKRLEFNLYSSDYDYEP